MVSSNLNVDAKQVAGFCRRHRIRKLAFFGSVLRQDYRPDSDVDVLVEFEPGQVPGFGFLRVQEELSALFGGRPVDLVTFKALNRRLRSHILRTAEVAYEQG